MCELSILIPVGRGDAHYVASALQGVLPVMWELITEDDWEGAGPAVTRNRLLDRARGEYVMMIDADNVFTVETIAAMNDAAYANTIVATERVEFFHDGGAASHEWNWRAWRDNDYRVELLSDPHSPLSTGNLLFRNGEARYPTNCGAYEGWAFFARRIVYDGAMIVTAPGTCYRHRLHDDSYYATRSREGLLDQDLRNALWHVYGDLLR